MIVVGLTGSIGMGKTTAAGMLRDMGVPVHDADAEVHRLLSAGGAGVAAVAREFPSALKKTEGGESFIDRAALGQAVFGHPERLKKLEDILHPLVRAASDAFKEYHREKGAEMIVLDIPLLFETKGEDRVDVILCVTADTATQKARVMARPGMTEEKFKSILARQMPDEEKIKRSDYVVRSDRGFDDMRGQLMTIVGELKARG